MTLNFVDGLFSQEQAKTPRSVRCRRTRRGTLRYHPWCGRAEGWPREGEGAEMAARRWKEDEGGVI